MVSGLYLRRLLYDSYGAGAQILIHRSVYQVLSLMVRRSAIDRRRPGSHAPLVAMVLVLEKAG
jgi:hypothetical protein